MDGTPNVTGVLFQPNETPFPVPPGKGVSLLAGWLPRPPIVSTQGEGVPIGGSQATPSAAQNRPGSALDMLQAVGFRRTDEATDLRPSENVCYMRISTGAAGFAIRRHHVGGSAAGYPRSIPCLHGKRAHE